MTMFFVHFEYGTCIYQDHDCGLEKFETREAALIRIAEILDREHDAVANLIEGVELNLPTGK